MKSKQLFFENLVAAYKVGGINQGDSLADMTLYEVVEQLLSESGAGLDGASAYEIWLSLDNTGDEQAFIASLTGPAGPQGAQGSIGETGPTGDPGPVGPTGPSGTVTIEGLVYVGNWDDLWPALFEYGDVVSYGGASYVRINQGSDDGTITPDVNPNWVLLASQGATGPTGATGEKGDTGVQGPTGADGPQGTQGQTGQQGPKGDQGLQGLTGPEGPRGLQGVKGDPGAQGSTGSTGSTGSQGPQGPAGPVGPAGLTWRSSWVATTSYVKDDAVGYDGASWFCIAPVSGNINNLNPRADGTHWALLASQGADGPQGPTGPAGATGATGATGGLGSQGPQGVQGPKGDDGNTGPQGPAGAQGVPGVQGPIGPQGAAGILLVTTTENASPVSIAPNVTETIVVNDGTKILLGSTIYITGVGYFYVETKSGNNIGVTNLYSQETLIVTIFEVVIVTGPPGVAGQGFTYEGNWESTTTYQPYDVVTYEGSTWITPTESTNEIPGIAGGWYLFTSKGDQGEPGTGGVPYYACNSNVPDVYTIITGNNINTNNVGDAYLIKFDIANTTTPTLQIDSATVATLYNSKTGAPLVSGDIEAGITHLIVYTLTNVFEVLTVGSGGIASTLQEVLTEGNTATDVDISLIGTSKITFDNGSKIKKGTVDSGTGGAGGIALICSLEYELKWEAGRLYILQQDGTQIREVRYTFTATPIATDDITKGFVFGSRWVLDNGDTYICTDSTEGSATWTLLTTSTGFEQNFLLMGG